ncbi:HAMP domain-containing protein [Aquabacterium fontiphilum]|uniref:methyl-accepting chemotaxis protein n=1 Tax=Aquabacterium fontiphilum TaxID=450365 RepID=UPI001377248F|nr:methyl-accepting chemotaxis protein [Aquabacterium fontiphilum]NBD19155.1 HAMP domain-containing protein [Aquabacterium fontiphilum]
MNWIVWLRNFSIRSRLLICMGLVVVIGTIVGAGMSWQLLNLQHEFDAFAEQEFTATQRMARLAQSMSDLRGHERAAIINAGDSVSAEEEFKAWQAALTTSMQRADELAKAAPSDDVRQGAQALKDTLKSYGDSMRPTLELVASLALASAAEAYQSSGPAREHAVAAEAATDKLNDRVTELAEARRDKAKSAVTQAIVSLWALLLSPGIIFLPLMGLTILSITGPLRRAEDITQAIAHGDLTRDIAPRGRDEIARLMSSMKTMQDGLREMVASVRESSESMLTASTEIAAGNQDLSNRTEQTASNLQAAASSMDQISKTVEHSADAATEANRLADTASSQAANGGDVVESVVSQMEQISQASRQISDIIGVIDGIAFQTNILALNAAVEAARAGEQGRGFAVVAGEVRSLAQRSAEAAREIKALIGKSVERVEVGSQKVREAGSVMTEIVSSIQRVTQAMGEIAEATRQQSAGIGQVTHSVTELDHMTQQNAALVEQSAAAADSLRQQARDLAQAVQRFRLS